MSSVGLLDLDVSGEGAILDQDTSPTSVTDIDAFAVVEDSGTWPTLTPTRTHYLAVNQLEEKIFDKSSVSNTVPIGEESQSMMLNGEGLENEDNETNRLGSRRTELEERMKAEEPNTVTLPSLGKVSPALGHHVHSRAGSKTGLTFRAPETKAMMVVPKLGTLVDFGPDKKNVGSSEDLALVAKSGVASLFEPEGLESLSLLGKRSTISDQPTISQAESRVDLGTKSDAHTAVRHDLGATGAGTLIDFDFGAEDGQMSQGPNAISTTTNPISSIPEYDLLTGIDEPDLLSPEQALDLSLAATLGIDIEGGFEEQEGFIKEVSFPRHTLNRIADRRTMYRTRGPAVGQGADNGSEHGSGDMNEFNSDDEVGAEEVILPISVKPLPFEQLEALLDS